MVVYMLWRNLNFWGRQILAVQIILRGLRDHQGLLEFYLIPEGFFVFQIRFFVPGTNWNPPGLLDSSIEAKNALHTRIASGEDLNS
jgi:hypothetical protein